jgi:hypothetical protein
MSKHLFPEYFALPKKETLGAGIHQTFKRFGPEIGLLFG